MPQATGGRWPAPVAFLPAAADFLDGVRDEGYDRNWRFLRGPGEWRPVSTLLGKVEIIPSEKG